MNLSQWILLAVITPTLGCGILTSSDDDDDDEDASTYSSDDGGGWATGTGGGSTGGSATGTGSGSSGTTGGGEGTGGDETGGGTSTGNGSSEDDFADGSCLIGTNTCIEPNEPNNDEWCSEMRGIYFSEDCNEDAFASCDIPAGGDFGAPATSYYYGEIDAETACEEAGGVYTGPSTSPEDHDHDTDDSEGGEGSSAGGGSSGGSTTGGGSGGGASDDDAESCSFGSDICIETNEPDEEAWCASVGGAYDDEDCDRGCTTGMCAIPAGGDYSRPATIFYYGEFDGESACESAGGTHYDLIDEMDEDCFSAEVTDVFGDVDIGLADESCSFGSGICIETTETDNEEWCWDMGGDYDDEDCDRDGATGICAVPVGGVYSSPATIFYFEGYDYESACSDIGGTYYDLTDDSDADVGTGGTSFDVDTLFVMWGGAYRDSTLVTATYIDEDGELQDYPNTYSFIWIDSEDYTEGSEEHICRLSYDINTAAMVADFSDLDGADLAYMTFMMDLGATTPETTGNCEGAAFAFGVGDMTAVVESTPWGFGYGPMTDEFEDELSDSLDDYAALGDRPGVSYLRWQNGSGDAFTAWGYFQVIPFMSDTTTRLDLPVEDPSVFMGGVRDAMTPADGLYYQETIYTLRYGG